MAGYVWIGDSKNDQVFGKAGTTMKCADPKFDHFVCLKEEDFQKLLKAAVH